MRDDQVPEEKLLKIIRGSFLKETDPQAKPAGTRQSQKTDQSYPFGQRINFNFFRAGTNRLQKILLVSFIIACASYLVSFVYPLIAPAVSVTQEAVVPSDQQPVESLQQIKPLAYYTDVTKNRRLFDSANAGVDSNQASIAGGDLAKDINLLGIVAGDKPEAVIEDKKTNKVFYVSPGMFIGEYQVEEIQESKVIMSRNGLRFELHL